jgi:hypothetical protein
VPELTWLIAGLSHSTCGGWSELVHEAREDSGHSQGSYSTYKNTRATALRRLRVVHANRICKGHGTSIPQ